ncbi:hypothetical protein LTR86_003568 [Recurvomyces mirabilis]|nr:hypothetical protein LTR86_003568 [Recurvomyces mirabilis]
MPGFEFIRSLGHAVDEFPVHTKALLEEERQRSRTAKDGQTSRSIISQLLQASADSEKGEGLTEEETVGNIFIFAVAGFDTTANTLSSALVLLARYPKWQNWLQEEIDRLLPPNLTSEEVDYASVFPQATRMLAFLFGVLRLYTALIHITKQTRTPQTLKTSQGEKWLPANVTIYINCVALHLDPAVYRNINLPHAGKESETDELSFRPTARWLNPSGSPQTFFQPPKGSFVPWSAGPRICPGQKMAQVEFTAVLMMPLRRHRLEAVPLKDEKDDATAVYERLERRMRDSVSILTLQMNDVYDLADGGEGAGIPLRLSKRE